VNLHVPNYRKSKRPILRIIFEDKTVLNRKKNLFFSDLFLQNDITHYRFPMFKPPEFQPNLPENRRKFQTFWQRQNQTVVRMESSLPGLIEHLEAHWKIIEKIESFDQVGVFSTNLGFLPLRQTVWLGSTSIIEAKNTSLVFCESVKRAVLSLELPYDRYSVWDVEICFKGYMDTILVPSRHQNSAPDRIRSSNALTCYHWFVDTDGLEVNSTIWNKADHISVNPLKQFFSGKSHDGLKKLVQKTADSPKVNSQTHLVHLLQPNMEIIDYDFNSKSRERVLDLYLKQATFKETNEQMVKVGASVLWSGPNSFFSIIEEDVLIREMLTIDSDQESSNHSVLYKILLPEAAVRHIHSTRPTKIHQAGVYFKKSKEEQHKFSLPFESRSNLLNPKDVNSLFTTLRWAFNVSNGREGFVHNWLEKNECSVFIGTSELEEKSGNQQTFCRAYAIGLTCQNHSS